MKSLLVLLGVLCVALLVTGRPTDEPEAAGEAAEGEEGKFSMDASAGGAPEEGEGSEPHNEKGDTVDKVPDGEEEGDSEGADKGSGAEEEKEGASEDEGDDEEADKDEGDDGKEDDGEGEDDGKEDDEGSSDEGGDDGKDGSDGKDGAGGEKESARHTYRQVHSLLKKIMKVDTKDKYLKSYVLARLQERLMNPTIDLVGSIEKYSKIKGCFSSLEKDVKKLVKDSDKAYKECTKDKNNGSCGNEGTRELDEGLIEREQELSDCIVEKRDAQ